LLEDLEDELIGLVVERRSLGDLFEHRALRVEEGREGRRLAEEVVRAQLLEQPHKVFLHKAHTRGEREREREREREIRPDWSRGLEPHGA